MQREGSRVCQDIVDYAVRLMVSANHGLINPLGSYVVYATIWELSAAVLYCCPVTVLEWDPGHVVALPPVTKL